MTQVERVIATLSSGPKTVAQLVEAGAISSGAASRACTQLIAQGVVIRTDGGEGRGQPATYELTPGGPTWKPSLHGDAARVAEDAYIEARKAGAEAAEAALVLDLTPSAQDRFEMAFRAETTAGRSFDNSCPKFAEHDRHLADLARVGAYPVMPRLAELRRAG